MASAAGLPKDQLVELITQLKILAHTQPDTARTIISSQPQLPQLILKQLFELDLVDTDLLLTTLQTFAQAQAGQPPAAAPPAPAPAAAAFVPGPPTYIAPAPAPAQYGYPPAPVPAPYPAPVAYASMPVPAPAPVPVAAPTISPAALAAMTDEQRQAILRVVQMTPDELALIPPAERGVYIELRRQFGIV
ncbi:hypothetical protein EXIGLDRAFT_731358 [Exidia glandulosa HHB12029]|uniref:Cleavage stimulation factor subunit 2 hinge domain-containing protein n=1 Tax=Exidia glandulosa HHB12029 TaxID=1314781 RepID=A0A165BWX3_EXIGL|nr:hypothetical protein EXIGLDRAFT_731358 [Exidia glandulosa HHB12029]